MKEQLTSFFPPQQILVLSGIIASIVVLTGWIIIAYFVVRSVNRRVAEALDSEAPDKHGDLRFLYYALSVLFWPAALGFGIYFLNNAGTARTGRVCIFILLGHFTFIFLIATGIVLAGLAYFPEIMNFFSK